MRNIKSDQILINYEINIFFKNLGLKKKREEETYHEAQSVNL